MYIERPLFWHSKYELDPNDDNIYWSPDDILLFFRDDDSVECGYCHRLLSRPEPIKIYYNGNSVSFCSPECHEDWNEEFLR